MKTEKNYSSLTKDNSQFTHPLTPSPHKGRGKISSVDMKNRKAAFTLAEVLITLGIIGVVAAMTIPNLVYEHQKKVVETRLQKFYSTINQAIELAELDYGPRQDWHNLNDIDTDKDGNAVLGDYPREKWVNKYLVPYMQGVKTVESTYNGYQTPIMYFADGSAVRCHHGSSLQVWLFYPQNPTKCLKRYGTQPGNAGGGVCSFYFSYQPNGSIVNWGNASDNFEPFKYQWDGTLEGLKARCTTDRTKRTFCSTWIQYNGWKIPDNYPLRISY